MATKVHNLPFIFTWWTFQFSILEAERKAHGEHLISSQGLTKPKLQTASGRLNGLLH